MRFRVQGAYFTPVCKDPPSRHVLIKMQMHMHIFTFIDKKSCTHAAVGTMVEQQLLQHAVLPTACGGENCCAVIPVGRAYTCTRQEQLGIHMVIWVNAACWGPLMPM